MLNMTCDGLISQTKINQVFNNSVLTSLLTVKEGTTAIAIPGGGWGHEYWVQSCIE